MNPENLNIFQLASQRLQWLSDRQRVVSENIANANTAEYQTQDVQSFESYLAEANAQKGAASARVEETESMWGSDPNGNTVVLEEQMMLASETSGQYRVAATLYRKAHEMIAAVSSGR